MLRHHFLLLSISVAILSATIISAWSPSRLHPSVHYRNRSVASLQGAFHRRFMASNDVDDEEDAEQETSAKYSGYNVLGTELSCCCSNVGGSGIGEVVDYSNFVMEIINGRIENVNNPIRPTFNSLHRDRVLPQWILLHRRHGLGKTHRLRSSHRRILAIFQICGK